MDPSAANLLQGTGDLLSDSANCKVACIAYATVRDSFIATPRFLKKNQ